MIREGVEDAVFVVPTLQSPEVSILTKHTTQEALTPHSYCKSCVL